VFEGRVGSPRPLVFGREGNGEGAHRHLGTARRLRKTLFWSGVLLAAGAALMMYQGRVDANAGLTDDAKLLWFASVPVVLLAFWSFVAWLGARVVTLLVAVRRD
jgi:hypothetical protein